MPVRPSGSDYQRRLDLSLERCKTGFTFADERERPQFFEWFERWFPEAGGVCLEGCGGMISKQTAGQLLDFAVGTYGVESRISPAQADRS